MKKNVRLFAFLLAILMTFTLTGCGEFTANPSTTHPTGSVPTTSTAGNYTAEDIAALIARLKTATSTTVGNYTAAMDLITGDFEARPEGTDSDEFRQMEADLVQTRDARLAALDAMIKVLEGLDPSATDAAAAKIAEAERMVSEAHHVYGEKILHSRNPEGASCTEADHYQICTQCNAVTWTKGEHQWFYSRNMEDHQKCCRLCDATEAKAQHDTNDQGKCSVCNYKMNANILIIESIAGESEKLSGMIASNHSLTVVGISDSARMPASIDELKVYDEVILVNVANRDMPEGFAELLQTYVQDLGGGLLTVGGNTADSTPDDWKANAYDRADLQGTIYQDMLPVDVLDPVSSIGVMIIIDRSGSMWYQMDGQPYEESKFYAAKQGAAACADALQAGDYMGIISLGDIYEYTPELIPITQKDKILNEIDNINFGGGTIFEGVLATARQALLANTQVQRRHIIMITDGEPADRDPEMYLEQARLNAEAGITMSVVGIDCLDPVKREMVKLVKAGGGEEKHFYDVGADSDGGYDFGVANAMREALRCDELRKVIYADYTPSVAVIILVDVSSSMWPGLADADYPYEQSKLYYAVAAAKASLDVLDANDYVGVMALADYYSTALELTPCSQRDKILQAISRVPDEGLGGTIFSAPLEAAGKALNAMTNVDKKHIVLITDGEPYAADTEAYQYMLRQNAAAGITTSIIGIQCVPTAAANMKATLVAHAGMEEKNFYNVSDLQSTVKAMQEDLSIPAFKEVKYNPFQPTLHASSITQGIAQADIPKLGGFYYSQLKDGATTIISKGSAPIYAHWNYGKGMVGSFMCDLNGTWSADFIASEEGTEIINRIIALLANPSEDP